MQLFECEACGLAVHFDNTRCTRCGHRLGFLPDRMRVAALAPVGTGTDRQGREVAGGWWQVAGEPDGPRYRQCRHYAVDGICNWMVPESDPDPFCRACRLNRTIPDLRVPGNRTLWARLEAEKRRLVYGLLRLGLPVTPRRDDPAGLAFDFLASTAPAFQEGGGVVTGHAAGLITLDIAEADPAVRERMREAMAEPYRTILGHFRHESGHHYWERLVRGGPAHEDFRRVFGDERADYDAALRRHYREGPPADWQERFVSAYASAHPWEDWAETWAHYLHIVDTLDTARAYGLEVGAEGLAGSAMSHAPDYDPYHAPDIDTLMDHWLPLTNALNSLNRSMGHGHIYPFTLTPAAIAKLRWVHAIIRAARDRAGPGCGTSPAGESFTPRRSSA
ncbi:MULTISPECIES: putative zinc-binding metallopeptidase [unclassified Thioalkalivibrio]|uniref:zinc-binding metallopeptidase family protein n=1 Tax=unclassified Thioalkalivibrio TaxID=2621013 RepID=UPI000382A324|nr:MULTISPECIES: putative zinc-binding peptidase [unclassified Thioalkalivibrio]